MRSPALLGEELDTGRVTAVQGIGQGCALTDVSQVAVYAQLQQWLHTVCLSCSCSPVQRCPGGPQGNSISVWAHEWYRLLSGQQLLLEVGSWQERLVAIYSVEMVCIKWGFRMMVYVCKGLSSKSDILWPSTCFGLSENFLEEEVVGQRVWTIIRLFIHSAKLHSSKKTGSISPPTSCVPTPSQYCIITIFKDFCQLGRQHGTSVLFSSAFL